MTTITIPAQIVSFAGDGVPDQAFHPVDAAGNAIYHVATNQTFTADQTWNGKLHVFQPDAPAVVTLNLPTVASLQASIGAMRMWILNNSPYAPVRIVLPTDSINGKNSMCGNFDVWNVIGDECIEIISDSPSVSKTDWKLLGKRPGVRQRRWTGPFTTSFSTSSSSYVNCTGLAAKLEQPLQSYSSREKVHVEGSVTCDTDGAVAFFTLSDGTSDVHASGTLGLHVAYLPNKNQPVPFSFTYEVPGGVLPSTVQKTWQLRAHGTIGTLRIGSDGTWPYETRMQIEELGVA